MASASDDQKQRLRTARVRAYQTYIIFRGGRLANHGMKLLTFLGLAVPLLVGGLITSVFTESKPPYLLLAISGVISTIQAVVSVWALVDKWEEKAGIVVKTTDEFRDIYIALDNLKPDRNGHYDEQVLSDLEARSYRGLQADDALSVRQSVRNRAYDRAEQRYPPIP